MDDEQYREVIKYVLQMIEKVVQIPERYLIDEDVIVEIGELSKEDMKKIDEMCSLPDPLSKEGLLRLDQNIDISKELIMVLKQQLKTSIEQIGEQKC